MTRKCYISGCTEQNSLVFCEHCHRWLCVEDIYKSECDRNQDGKHSPVSVAIIDSGSKHEVEVELISEMVH
jgi:hypothetical protein